VPRVGFAVEALGLTKRYGDVVAVAGLDFAVQAGEVFGFLGPNGAGKTSKVRWQTTAGGGTIAIKRRYAAKTPEPAQQLGDGTCRKKWW
jgi:ABC-type uncharacterized transport system ATPase subunit